MLSPQRAKKRKKEQGVRTSLLFLMLFILHENSGDETVQNRRNSNDAHHGDKNIT